MKKKKVGVLVSAIATSAVCVSMVAGSTFALFTDEDSVNVAVTAANVKVDVEVETGKTVSTIGAETYGGFAAEALALTNVTPGETYSFTVKATNASSIAALCKTSIEFTNVKLAAAFDVTIGGVNYGAVQSYVTAWEKFDKGAQIFGEEGLSVEIAFPYSDESQNEYQGLSTDITVKVEAVQANAQGYTVGGEAVAQKIVTAYDTESAQKALAETEDNTTIFLAAGNYDVLKLDQSATHSVNLASRGARDYKRTVNNLTILGEEGTVVDGFRVETGHHHVSAGKDPVVDPVTGIVYEIGSVYYSTMVINNLKFDNVTFTENVYFGADSPDFLFLDGLTLVNCAMKGMNTTTNEGNKLLRIGGSATTPAKNVVVENCKVDNAFQGVFVYGYVDLTVRNCTFTNLGHNAVQHAGASGKAIIQNNVMIGGVDRVMRFDNFAGERIVVTGNVMINYADSDGEMLKASSVPQAEVIMNGNYWNGKTSGLESVIINMGAVDEAPLGAAVCDSYDFTDAAQAAAFCPDCYNGKGEHSAHTPYLDVDPEKGVANVSRNGAWLAYKTLDWDTNRYEFSYDVDLTALGEGSAVAFDGGDANTWQTSIQIGFKKQGGQYYTYSGTTAPNGLTGCTEYASDKASITYVFDKTDGVITVTVLLNGKEFRTRTYSSEAAQDIYWNVYTCDANDNETQLCALSNMKLTAIAK